MYLAEGYKKLRATSGRRVMYEPYSGLTRRLQAGERVPLQWISHSRLQLPAAHSRAAFGSNSHELLQVILQLCNGTRKVDQVCHKGLMAGTVSTLELPQGDPMIL